MIDTQLNSVLAQLTAFATTKTVELEVKNCKKRTNSSSKYNRQVVVLNFRLNDIKLFLKEVMRCYICYPVGFSLFYIVLLFLIFFLSLHFQFVSFLII